MGSAHKFNGPKGVGFLYVKEGTEIAPLIDGGSQERGLVAGTENVPGIVGMATALKQATDSLPETARKLQTLETILLSTLEANGVPFERNGAPPFLPGLLSLAFPGADAEALLHRLDLAGVQISTGSACDGQSKQISRVLRAVKLPKSLAQGTIRISLGKYNSEQEAKSIANAITKALAPIRKPSPGANRH